MAAVRQVIHVDLDAFFASVEELLNPDLRGKPVIVGADPRGRGVVSAASYAARRYGVHSAMPISQAFRLCPQGVFLPVRHDVYGKYSRRVMALLAEYTSRVEKVSVDEAFLDLTEVLGPGTSVRDVAAGIQARVRGEIGLPCSLGVATNRLTAKIATEVGKPNGLVVVEPGHEEEFLAPLPIELLWGVGPKTAARLKALGIEKIGELASARPGLLESELGPSHGAGLREKARGHDDSEVTPWRPTKSISQEHTFQHDTGEFKALKQHLLALSEGVAKDLRKEVLQGRTVTLKIRFASYTTFTRAATLGAPTDQGQVIFEAALALLNREWRQGMRIRLLGVRASNLVSVPGRQLGLFQEEDARQSKLSATVDEIEKKYGEGAISRASLINRRPDEP